MNLGHFVTKSICQFWKREQFQPTIRPIKVGDIFSISRGKFTNILRAAFGQIFFCQKITKPNCKNCAKHFHTKGSSRNVDEIDT